MIAMATVRKTFKYKLNPTPEQERALETVLVRCRALYNCALEQRRTWWGRGQGIGASYYRQKAELPDLKAGLNKSIQDAGWSAFRRILTCKAAWAGKRVEAIPRRTPHRSAAAVGSG